MKKDKLNHITRQQYRKIKKYGKNILPGYDVETIHQFRVSYKRLRAFLRMIAEADGKKKEVAISKSLKAAYRVSGAIRDRQLQQQRIRKATRHDVIKPKAYLSLLQKEINKLKPRLVEILSTDPVDKSKKKTDAAMPHLFPENKFRDFVHKKRDDVYEIIAAGHFTDTNIHTIRKNLKDLFYNFEIYGGVGQGMLAHGIWKGKGKDDKYFSGLLDELGLFQDQCIAISLIKPGWLNILPQNNHTQLERIRKIWLKDKLEMKQLLVKKLKTDLISQ